MTPLPLPDEFFVARKLAGLTQAELAERVGTTTKHYQRIESGYVSPRYDTLARIAAALGLRLTVAKESEDSK